MKHWKIGLLAAVLLSAGAYAWAQEAIDGSVAGTTGLQVMGTDGTNAQIIKTDTTGAVQIDCETGCGGGTQFAEDAPHTTGDLGTQGSDEFQPWDEVYRFDAYVEATIIAKEIVFGSFELIRRNGIKQIT